MRPLFPLLLVLLAFDAHVAEAQRRAPPDSLSASVAGVVRGRFREEVRTVGYAVVELDATGSARSTVADAQGRYRLPSLAGGVAVLRVSAPGYDPLTLEILVPARGVLPLDVELRGRPLELAPLDVTRAPNIPDPGRRVPEPGAIAEVEVTALELAPGVGQPGLLEALGAMPGNDAANATDVLFMRGSTTDLKLVLLDGAPVYTPFHVAGLLRAFEPGILGSASLHVGGAPARYDGGLTHILDLRTRRPYRESWRGSGSADLLSATAAVEGPLGGSAGFLASARALHGLGSAPLGGDPPYGYRDGLLAFEAEPGDDRLVSGTLFWNEEAVRLDFPGGPDDAWWSNRAASLRYQDRVGAVLLDLGIAGGAYDAELPLQPTAPEGDSLPGALIATAANERLRMTVDASRGMGGGTFRAGASFESLEAAYAARSMEEGTSPEVTSRATTVSGGVYVDVTRDLGEGVSFRGGLRADAFDGGRAVALAPRAALTWELTSEAMLTVAAGRYHQAARAAHPEVERTLTAVVEDSVQSSQLLPVASADHVVVSLDQRLGERVHLGLDGFWKGYDGLLSDPGEDVRSSGIDLRVQSAAERGTVWLGYGLSWFWSKRDLSGATNEFEGRHLLSAGLSGRIAGAVGGEARIAYGAGLPYTAIPFRGIADAATSAPGEQLSGGDSLAESGTPEQPLVQGLDDEFLRLDLELHALLERRWGGRLWELRPYVRLMNALDRRDAMFYAFQPWRDDSLRPLAERPLLPVLGVAVRF